MFPQAPLNPEGTRMRAWLVIWHFRSGLLYVLPISMICPYIPSAHDTLALDGNPPPSPPPRATKYSLPPSCPPFFSPPFGAM